MSLISGGGDNADGVIQEGLNTSVTDYERR